MKTSQTLVIVIGIVVLLVAAIFVNGYLGQDETATPPEDTEGETCVSCHTDIALLQADLAANPLPEKQQSEEAEGEG